MDRERFLADLKKFGRSGGVGLTGPERKAVLSALSERDESAAICRDKSGNPEPDSSLRDTECVPLKENVEDYFRREVLPHAILPGLAGIDQGDFKTLVRHPAQKRLGDKLRAIVRTQVMRHPAFADQARQDFDHPI